MFPLVYRTENYDFDVVWKIILSQKQLVMNKLKIVVLSFEQIQTTENWSSSVVIVVLYEEKRTKVKKKEKKYGFNKSVQWGMLHKNPKQKNLDSGKAVFVGGGGLRVVR